MRLRPASLIGTVPFRAARLMLITRSGYDLVLLTNFLHHFDPPTNEEVVRQSSHALVDGGRAVTLEFVPNGIAFLRPNKRALA